MVETDVCTRNENDNKNDNAPSLKHLTRPTNVIAMNSMLGYQLSLYGMNMNEFPGME